MQAWAEPGSPALGKVQELLATEGLQTLQFQEMRRITERGWVLFGPIGGDPSTKALLIHARKQPEGQDPRWRVTDAEILPAGKGLDRIRELAPNVVPVTPSSSGMGGGGEVAAEARYQAQVKATMARLDAAGASPEVKARVLAALQQAHAQSVRASVTAGGEGEVAVTVEKPEQTSPKMLQPTADGFVSALVRRDPDAVKALILPGSPAEAKVGDLLNTVGYASLYVRSVRRVDTTGLALAIGAAPSDGSPQMALLTRLVLKEHTPQRDIWRVTDVDYLPLEQAQLQMSGPSSQPATQRAGAAADVRRLSPGTFEFHAQGADLRGVLHTLSTQAHKSVVASKQVTGTVTVDLYGVNFAQALEALVKSQGFVYREKNGIIEIYTPAELDAVLKSERSGAQAAVVETEPLGPPATQPAPSPSPRPGGGF